MGGIVGEVGVLEPEQPTDVMSPATVAAATPESLILITSRPFCAMDPPRHLQQALDYRPHRSVSSYRSIRSGARPARQREVVQGSGLDMTERRTRQKPRPPRPKERRATAPPLRRKPRAAATRIAPGRLLALFASRDIESLIEAVFPLLRAAVPCDFISAFYRSSGNGLLKARDSLGREYGAAYMIRQVALNPAIPYAVAHPGIRLLPTRIGLPRPDAELQRTDFYREVMQVEGWRHSVALCFWADPAGEMPILVVGVNRREGSRDFSKRDLVRLERVYPFIDCAVTRLHEQELAHSVIDSMTIAARGSARGFAILDRHFRLVKASPTARGICAEWLDGGAVGATGGDNTPGWRLPPMLAAGCRALQEEWHAGVRANPGLVGLRRSRVVHARNFTLTASLTLVSPGTTGLAEPSILIEFNRVTDGAALNAPEQAEPLLRTLTAAERAVAVTLAEGLSNQEIADRLGKSTHAVKYLLHRVYQKTGMPGRTALVAALRAGPVSGSSSRAGS